MPYLKLNTNVAVADAKQTSLMAEMSRLLAAETGKPERYVMIELAGGKPMLFGGNDQALAYLECKSIGLTEAQARSLSSSLSRLLEKELAISQDRIYIEFSNCPAAFWGWSGSTFG